MFWARVSKETLAACDKDLIGEKFEEAEKTLHVKEEYYKEKLINEEELISLLKEKTSINLVGRESIALARSQGLADNIIRVQGTPHAIIIKL